MSYIKVRNAIDNGDIAPVYFFYGTETYLMEDLIDALKAKVTDDVTTYSLLEVPIEDVIEDAETFSFFGDKKLIVAKDFFAVTSEKREEKVQHHLPALETYLSNPAEMTHLVFICESEKLDARKKITKAIQRHAVVVECKPFDDAMMNEWLQIEAKKRRLTFAEGAKEALVARVGTNLLLLAAEMEKFALYVGENGTVSEDVIEELTARTLESDVFSLIDKAVQKKLDEALLIYRDLLMQKEEPIKILILIARQLRIYYQVKQLLNRSYSQKQIATQLKLHPYVVKLATKKIHNFTDDELLDLIKAAADFDYQIKSGKIDKQLAIELLLLKIAKRG